MSEPVRPTDVAVGLIHDATMDARFVRCLTGLNAQRRPGMETLYVESGGGSLDRGRNLLVQKFLQTTDQPWFLQVDTDMHFGIEEFDQLLHTAKDKDIVSGLYFANERPPRPAMYRWDEKGHAASVMEWEDHDVLEVDGCGAGFLLVRREVYEKMDHPEEYRGRAGSWFTQDALGPAGQLTNEDNAFCIRAQAH
ncbi:MAG TPA: hypothetical protein VFY54_07195, partial [Rubrobacter sp.]|nr:hypothetical protein [Rubrobacter sp.]